MRYGNRMTITEENGVVRTVEESFRDFVPGKVTIYSESKIVSNDKEILAEFLGLLDRYNRNEIQNPGIQVLGSREKTRVEKTWLVAEK